MKKAADGLLHQRVQGERDQEDEREGDHQGDDRLDAIEEAAGPWPETGGKGLCEGTAAYELAGPDTSAVCVATVRP